MRVIDSIKELLDQEQHMTTAQMYDRNMELARRLAEGLGPPPELPSSLQKIESRCQLVSAIDGPLVVRSTPEEGMEYLGKRIAKIRQLTSETLSDLWMFIVVFRPKGVFFVVLRQLLWVYFSRQKNWRKCWVNRRVKLGVLPTGYVTIVRQARTTVNRWKRKSNVV